jgi:hypothetical protein
MTDPIVSSVAIQVADQSDLQMLRAEDLISSFVKQTAQNLHTASPLGEIRFGARRRIRSARIPVKWLLFNAKSLPNVKTWWRIIGWQAWSACATRLAHPSVAGRKVITLDATGLPQIMALGLSRPPVVLNGSPKNHLRDHRPPFVSAASPVQRDENQKRHS